MRKIGGQMDFIFLALVMAALAAIAIAYYAAPPALRAVDAAAETAVARADRAGLRELLARADGLELPDGDIGRAYRAYLAAARETAAYSGAAQADIDAAAESLWAAYDRLMRYIVRADDPKTSNRQLLGELLIYGVRCAFDAASATFFFPSPVGVVRAWDLRAPGEEPVLLLWEPVAPQFGRAYSLTAVSRSYSYTYSLIFTGLPIVQISGITDAAMSRTLRPAGFSLTYYSEHMGRVQSVQSQMLIRHRGASSMAYPKKSFAIRLTDRHGVGNNNISLLGMRRSSSWILDAMYIDRSKMRERVSMDIWNSYSSPLAHEGVSPIVQNGTRGRYAEVFIGDEYWGLYCLTETINRQQIGLRRYVPEEGVRSVKYNGQHWGSATLFRGYRPGPPAAGYFWSGFRQDFPDPRRGEPAFWEPIYEFVQFVVNSSDEQFSARIADFIQVGNFVEYLILQVVSYAHDNTGKNLIWSIYDVTDPELNRIFLTPWDLDATWGDTWHFGRTHPTATWLNVTPEHDSVLWRRLVYTNAGGFRDKLVARWLELREAQLSVDSILAHFDAYFRLFEETGAWRREIERWPRHGQFERGLTLEAERDYIFGWVRARWPFIDDFIINRLDEVRPWGR